MRFCGGVGVAARPGLCQLTAGVLRAGEHLDQCARTGLTAQATVDQRLAVLDPIAFQRGACTQQHHHVGVCRRHSCQQFQLVLCQLHVGAVDALALLDLVQTHAQQHHVGVLCQPHRLGFQCLIGLALPVKALGVADAVQAALGKAVQKGIHLDGVDGAGACTLIAGRLGKVADDRHLFPFCKGQQAVFVLQQHDALGSSPACQCVVGVGIELAGCGVHRRLGGEHQFQQLLQPGVHVRFGDLAGLHRFHQLPDGVPAGGGHFQRRAVLYAEGVVVAAAPVGDHCAVKAPVPAQDIHEQVGVLVGVGAVDKVIGGHDGLRLRFLDHHLETGQVNFPQGALVHDGIRGHAAQLLTVHGKVLGAGGNAVFLDAADVGRRHLTGKVGILREILEVAAAQGAALDVQAGAQQHRHALCRCLFAHGCAHSLAKLRVPAVGNGGRGGEAGGGHTGVQAQMVGCARLLTHAVGAVRQGNGRDALARQRPGGEHRAAAQQGAFLFQRQALDDICVFHGSLLTIKKRGRAFARRPFCSYVLIRRFLRPLSFCGSGGSSERPEPRSDRRRHHPLRR